MKENDRPEVSCRGELRNRRTWAFRPWLKKVTGSFAATRSNGEPAVSWVSVLALVLVAMLSPVSALAQSAARSEAIEAQSAISAISAQLQGDDPAVISQGVAHIQSLLQTSGPKIVAMLRNNWMKRLMELQRYDDVNNLSLLAILAAPAETVSVEQFQSDRVQALLAQGKGPEALIAAKQLFDVCTLKGTADAIRVICQCLNTVHPDDREVLRRYRREQIEGAKTDAVNAATEPLTLSAVQVDPTPYEPAIRRISAEDYRSLTGQGNLLLLADKPKEAWDVFERAYSMASDRDLAAASESLARCMKAEDGTIGRANAWVLSIRPKAQMASERSPAGFPTTQVSSKE